MSPLFLIVPCAFFGANDFKVETRFSRFLHSVAKSSQDATSKTFRFVPLQDFTENSDVDWSKDILDIDKMLYTKYNLSEEEINFIESMIRPMDLSENTNYNEE
jgi:hypothetical protein